METILCPYCECRVMIRAVDDEGGMCPECGAVITGAMMLNLDDAFDDEIEGSDDEEEDPLDPDREIEDDVADEDQDF